MQSRQVSTLPVIVDYQHQHLIGENHHRAHQDSWEVMEEIFHLMEQGHIMIQKDGWSERYGHLGRYDLACSPVILALFSYYELKFVPYRRFRIFANIVPFAWQVLQLSLHLVNFVLRCKIQVQYCFFSCSLGKYFLLHPMHRK